MVQLSGAPPASHLTVPGRSVLGTERFREVGRTPGRQLLDDIFASCANGPAPRGSRE
jgi:hypothetical protein